MHIWFSVRRKYMLHKDIIDKMTLEEKAAFLGGAGEWNTRSYPRLDIPEMIMSDGPHGIRRQAGAGDHLGLNESLKATCFPTAATMANSWDEELGEEVGRALGDEAKALGVNVLLGPGMNIKRNPLCGRNFEYFSEDPYLAGKMAASYVRGIQSKGVYSCIKHFAVNSQEERRMAMNAVLDERTLREIYLTGFEIAVKDGGAKAVMTSYNMVNGIYANENTHLLRDILRGEWGFDGVVITDWGGSNDHVAGVRAGSDLEMPAPGLGSARLLLDAVEKGELSEDIIDERVDELLDAVLKTTAAARGHADTFDTEEHHRLSRRAATESAVLLKNDDSILPLTQGCKVAVIGDFAFTPRYQGAGSSVVNVTKLETVAEQIISDKHFDVVGMARGYERNAMPNEVLKSEAIELARTADAVLYFFGLDEISESEGLDRKHMKLPEAQTDLLLALAGVNQNIIGIMSAGSSVEMGLDAHLKALLHMYLTGQAGASAALDLISGRVNPSGRLAETYPWHYEDTPSAPYYPAQERNSDYREAIYVGYRYFDKADKEVRYPFGYGLSYTSFSYSDLSISDSGISVSITNTGGCDGAETVQMYVSKPDSRLYRAAKELKGFRKVFLKAGETATVEIPFDERTFRYWNIKTNSWETEGGEYQILIGASSREIKLSGSIVREATDGGMEVYDAALIPSYMSGQIESVSDAEFAAILGHGVPDGSWGGEITENDAICQLRYAKSGFARFVYRRLETMKLKSEKEGKPDLNTLFIYNMPLRATAKMTGGMVDMNMVDGMVTAVNGHFFKGLGHIIGAFFKNRSANKKYEKMIKGE